jgi:hypothetical protein
MGECDHKVHRLRRPCHGAYREEGGRGSRKSQWHTALDRLSDAIPRDSLEGIPEPVSVITGLLE